MKTVSAKLERKDHDRFLNLCNLEGCTVSEALRDMILQWCDAGEEDAETEKDSPKPMVTIIEDIPKLRSFSCSNGFLYENGALIGNCSDYVLRHGEVYDKKGIHLGTIKN
ncbi:MAG: hypothetical protein JRZ94_04150 [Nitrososphaerota archaeon]|nr:hypothetical protein [Nitrososphaerota archaeon]